MWSGKKLFFEPKHLKFLAKQDIAHFLKSSCNAKLQNQILILNLMFAFLTITIPINVFSKKIFNIYLVDCKNKYLPFKYVTFKAKIILNLLQNK